MKGPGNFLALSMETIENRNRFTGASRNDFNAL
jgi:hypothetical protein